MEQNFTVSIIIYNRRNIAPSIKARETSLYKTRECAED